MDHTLISLFKWGKQIDISITGGKYSVWNLWNGLFLQDPEAQTIYCALKGKSLFYPLPALQLGHSESLHFHVYVDCLRNNGFHFADLYGVSTYHLTNGKKKTKLAIWTAQIYGMTNSALKKPAGIDTADNIYRKECTLTCVMGRRCALSPSHTPKSNRFLQIKQILTPKNIQLKKHTPSCMPQISSPHLWATIAV